jgi:hypothetical protein
MVQALRRNWTRVVRHRIFPPACDQADCRASASARVWRGCPPIRMREAWLCSPQCLEREARSIFDRISSSPRMSSVSHHRVPLGLLLLEHGYVNQEQLRTALAIQMREHRGRIGDWLQALHFVTERQVLIALGVQWACPLLSARQAPDAACATILPLPLLRALRQVPVCFIPATRLLYIAVCLKIDYSVLAAIEQMVDCRPVPCLVSDCKMDEWLGQAQNCQRDVQVFDRISGSAEMARITASYAARVGAEEVRIVPCGPYIWTRLLAGGDATDLLFGRKGFIEQRGATISSTHTVLTTRTEMIT